MTRSLRPSLPERIGRPSRPVPRRLRAALLLPLLLVLLVAACDGGTTEEEGLEATGVVVDVRGSITEVEEFELALSDGTRMTLVPEAGVLEAAGFSPAHLREHMAIAEPISVRYRDQDGRNIVIGVDDAG